MNHAAFRDLVRRLRAAQKSYFRSRAPIDLEGSKQLEREVDRELADATPSMFGEEPRAAAREPE